MKKIIVILLILFTVMISGCRQSQTSPNLLSADFTPSDVDYIEQSVQSAENESGVKVNDEDIFVPLIVHDMSTGYGVTITRYEKESLLSVEFKMNETQTEKYEISSMGTGKFNQNTMYGGEMTIEEWLTSTNPQIFNDGERDYYITVFDWEGDENAKGFILRYIIEENTVFNVSGKILHFEGDILTEQMARNIYEDFKVIRLSELKS